MPLTEQDRERLADDIYSDRRITVSVYCSKCGYDLRTLPYIYQCPECGQDYNARALSMKGIFLPHHADPPFREIALVAVCGTGAVIMLGSGVNPPDIWRLLFGLTLGGFCIMEVGTVWRKIRNFFKARAIRRKIERGEG